MPPALTPAIPTYPTAGLEHFLRPAPVAQASAMGKRRSAARKLPEPNEAQKKRAPVQPWAQHELGAAGDLRTASSEKREASHTDTPLLGSRSEQQSDGDEQVVAGPAQALPDPKPRPATALPADATVDGHETLGEFESADTLYLVEAILGHRIRHGVVSLRWGLLFIKGQEAVLFMGL